MIEFKIYLDSTFIRKAVLPASHITIGRSEDNDLVLDNPHVSRLEAIIEWKEDQVVLFDKSRNGILVDSQRVSGSQVLPSHCRIHIYPFEIECLSLREDETIPIPSIRKQETTAHPGSVKVTTKHQPAVSHFCGLVGDSPPMQQVYQLIKNVGDSPATVLIRGAHGTGKELVARALHEVSPRKGKVFIPVNCAAIPLDLIESELFGYEKGAFTGAQAPKAGKIEEAAGGTIFLDEIGELSMSAQVKLLRFLQGKTVMRLGSSQEVPVDVRVVTATNRNLEKAVQEGDFREDLYYRLRVVQIALPPLRERPEDIPTLVKHFTKKIAEDLGLDAHPLVTDEILERLTSGQWPGNVRQLENVLYSAILRSRPSHLIDESILMEDASNWLGSGSAEPEAPLEVLSKQALIQVLTQHQWDTVKAAEVLKVSRGTIYYKMKKYGIEPPRPSQRGRT